MKKCLIEYLSSNLIIHVSTKCGTKQIMNFIGYYHNILDFKLGVFFFLFNYKPCVLWYCFLENNSGKLSIILQFGSLRMICANKTKPSINFFKYAVENKSKLRNNWGQYYFYCMHISVELNVVS
jgi:hypothetical protein